MLAGLQSRKELLEERIVNTTPLGVILYSAGKGIVSKMYLLDDAIVSGPGFHFQIISQLLDRLVMRAVHF